MADVEGLTKQVAQVSGTMIAVRKSAEDLATHFGWKPDTIMRRAEAALPAPFEQVLYFTLAREMEWRGFPETFRDILRYFAGSQDLSGDRLQDRHFSMAGKQISAQEAQQEVHLTTNAGERIVESVVLVMELANWAKGEGFAIPAKDLVRLVHAYGEHAEHILGMLGEQLEEIRDTFQWKKPLPAVMGMVVRRVAECAADADSATPVPNVASIEDVIALFRHTVPHEGWREEEE